MHRVYIVRHGERIDHVDRSWKTGSDLPDDPFLTVRGLKQAHDLAVRLKDANVTHIFCSPFYRCIQTANETAKLISVPIKLEHGAGEFLSSRWFKENPRLRSTKDLASEFHMIDTSYESFWKPQYPESLEQLSARTGSVTKHLVDNFLDSGSILIVSHGHVIEKLANSLAPTVRINWVTYCALVELCPDSEGSYCVEANGDTSYLSEPENSGFRPKHSCLANGVTTKT
mmetsp:Transcript_36527/g.146047  ORF Transcript_36527/g.146047 Transcript_36527/m.146047 type:complete len:228 (-) Transcript_36527:1266-1949(-)